MAPKRSLLDRMSENPRDDWTFDDIAKLANQEGLELAAPTRGSHHTLRSPFLRDVQTVPYKRPVKVIYVKQVVSYVLAHREAKARREQEDT